MSKYTFVFMLLAILSTSANADSGDRNGPKFVGIGISDKSGSSVALRFIPPDEDGWSIERSGLSVTLKKNSGSDSDSREIEAYLIRLDTPISPISNYIETIRRNTVEGYARSNKFKISTLEIAEDPKDTRCARVHLLLEGLQSDAVVQQRKWSEQYMLSCGLLKHKGLGFELRYYHRYLDSNKDTQFGEKARKVLESVILEDG